MLCGNKDRFGLALAYGLCSSSNAMAAAKALSSKIPPTALQVSAWPPWDPKHALSMLVGLAGKRDLPRTRKAYVLVIESGLDPIDVLTNHFIRLFTECGSLQDVSTIVCRAPNMSVYTWQAIISAHSSLGEPIKALELYNIMQQTGVTPDRVVLVCVLKICSILFDAEKGRCVHDDIVRNHFESDAYAQTSLINMYGKCGYLAEAWKVFENTQTRDVVMWGAIISGYSEHEHPIAVLEIFEMMLENGIPSDRVTFSCALKACGNLNMMSQGNLLYNLILRQGQNTDIIVNSSVVDMYAKCGNLTEAKNVFESMPARDVVSWSAIISGFTECNEGFLALEAYQAFLQEGLRPDAIMFLSLVKACGELLAFNFGVLIHDQIIRSSLESEVEIANSLIGMYAKFRLLTCSNRVFERLRNLSCVVSWDLIIAAHTQNGRAHTSLKLFERMLCHGVMPARSTYSYVLKACAETKIIDFGRGVHKCIVAAGLEWDKTIGNSLIIMYGNLGHADEACKIFDGLLHPDVVSWSVLIASYAEAGLGLCALNCFGKMQDSGIEGDKYTLTSVLQGCGSLGSVDMGRVFHDQIIQSCTEIDNVVKGALIDMYVKSESLEDAGKVFGEGINCDIVSWNTMIEGYVQHEQAHLALKLYNKMQDQNILPESSTFISILRACGVIGAEVQGKIIHSEIIKNQLELDIVICNTLIDMYGKCAHFNEARKILGCLPNQNVVSWNAMIAGYSQHGLSRNALECFEGMLRQGWKPNASTYTSILGACNHACEIKLALQHFMSMTEEHGIRPTLEHFDCVIDLLARSGFLEEADRLLQSMPFFPDSFAWSSLLSACKVYDNIDVGRHCFQNIASMNPTNAASYMLMSNIYANVEILEGCTD